MSRLGWETRLCPTESGGHTTELARQAASEGVDAVIVAGGDGSLEHAIPSLVGTRTALGVLPAGTANVWAQELGFPTLNWTHRSALQESANLLAGARVQRVDVGFWQDRPFLLWAGVGLDAFIVHNVEPRKPWEKYFGMAHYALSALLSTPGFQSLELQVRTEGEHHQGRFMLAVLSNIRHYAGGLANLSPSARLDDGIMELWLFHGESLGDGLKHVWDLWSGRHGQSPRVEQFHIRQAQIEAQKPMFVQFDGEPVTPSPMIDLQVRKQALRALVPTGYATEMFTEPALGLAAQ